jgi:hypothetical protein
MHLQHACFTSLCNLAYTYTRGKCVYTLCVDSRDSAAHLRGVQRHRSDGDVISCLRGRGGPCGQELRASMCMRVYISRCSKCMQQQHAHHQTTHVADKNWGQGVCMERWQVMFVSVMMMYVSVRVCGCMFVCMYVCVCMHTHE